MKYEKLKDSAENIKMPDELKTRILDRCSDIAANEKRSGIEHNSDHVSGVERVSSRPVRRTFAAVAACAVLAAGVGTAIHFMPKTSHNTPASNMSDTLNDNILEALSDLLDRDFTGTNDEGFSDEQRNEIKNILSEYEWTEISHEQFFSGAASKPIYMLEVIDGNSMWELDFYEGHHAIFQYIPELPEEDDEEGKESQTLFYSVNSAEIVQRINDMLASAENDAPRPLADITEKPYREVGLSAKDSIPDEKRAELAEFMSTIEFTYEPDCIEVNQTPAYFFSCASDRTYFYYNGTAEVHEDGKTYFYNFDFDKLSKGIDDILLEGLVFTGKDLLPDDFLNTEITFHGLKKGEFVISQEAKQAIYDYLSTTRFRSVGEDGSASKFLDVPLESYSSKQLGFINYDLIAENWNLSFYESGAKRYDINSDDPSASTNTGFYLYDPVALDSAITEAIPELSSSYPPFGTIYKMGNAKVNGKEIREKNLKEFSNTFFGLNWINEVVSDSFREEEPVYTIEVEINDGTLIIRTYTDGTLEYKDDEGNIHTYDKIGCPDNFSGNLFDDIQRILEDTSY